MSEFISIRVNGEEASIIKQGTTLFELSEKYKAQYASPIVLANVNGYMRELFNTVKDGDIITFSDIMSHEGFMVYQRSVSFILICAAKEILGTAGGIKIQHSINKNYYCEFQDETICSNKELLAKIENAMRKIVDANERIEKYMLSLGEGVKLMSKDNMQDKVNLLKYRRVSSVNLYKLCDTYDYFYGYMAMFTGCLKWFALIQSGNGFILQFPLRNEPTKLPKYHAFDKIMQVFREDKNWGKILRITNVGELNDVICKEQYAHVVRVAEALQEKRIAQIADMIYEKREKVKIILIAGPSSSGKTTFAARLSVQLGVNGIRPRVISIDNYFKSAEATPKDEFGNCDFDSINHVDVELFNRHLSVLLKGEEVELPVYNFRESKPEFKGDYLRLCGDDMLIVEGTHGLNEILTQNISRENKFLIFISALTQLNLDCHNRIPTTDTRLIRRIIRDNMYRGVGAEQTFELWESVRRGEAMHVFPYQENADVIFNSALVYELCVLKLYVDPLLFNVSIKSKYYNEAKRLIKFLDSFLPISSEYVPQNSLLREFIGGSCFHN